MSTSRSTSVIQIRLALTPNCLRCGSDEHIAVHHIVSIADGGPDHIDNTTSLCSACHNDWHWVFEGYVTWESFKTSIPSRFIQQAMSVIDDDTTTGTLKQAYYGGLISDPNVVVSPSTRQRKRQKEGIAKAKAAGVYKRGPVIDAAEVLRRKDSGENPSVIARAMGISRMSVYRTLNASVG